MPRRQQQHITSTTSNNPKAHQWRHRRKPPPACYRQIGPARHDLAAATHPDPSEPRNVAAQSNGRANSEPWNLEPNSPEPPRPTLTGLLPANDRFPIEEARPRKAPNQQGPPQPSRSPKSAHLAPSTSQRGLQQGTRKEPAPRAQVHPTIVPFAAILVQTSFGLARHRPLSLVGRV
jgi:hypothetical protein